MRRFAIPLALTLAALAVPTGSGAMAQSICARPLNPVCMDDGGLDGADSLGKQRCIEDMKSYMGQQEEYVTCLRSSLESSETSLTSLRERIKALESEIHEETKTNAEEAKEAAQ